MVLNLKRNKTFKVIITTLLVIAFTVSAISCKEVTVVEEQVEEQLQEEEKPAAEVSNETKEETKKETPPVVEETPEEIEWEGMIITPIEGLRFDKGTFYAEAGNPYGLEVGEKAGVFVKDAVEINEVMESSIGLRPEVIEVIQKEIMEKDKEFKYPLPFDLEQAKGIKIKDVHDIELDDLLSSEQQGYDANKGTMVTVEPKFWDKNFFLSISNVPLGTIIYSPVNSQEYLIWDNNFGRNDPQEPSWFQLGFSKIIPEAYKGELFFKNERIDMVDLEIELGGVSLLPSGIEKNITLNKIGGYSFLTEINLGEPIAEVVSKSNLPRYNEPDYNPEAPYNPDLPSIEMDCGFDQLKNKNAKLEISNISKILYTGLVSSFKIGDIPVFINPAHD